MHLPCRFVCIASINIKKCSCLELINPFPFHGFNSKVVRVTIHLFVAFQHSILIAVFVVKLGVKSQTFNHFDPELRKACTCRTIAVSGLLVAIAFFAGEESLEMKDCWKQRFSSRKTVDSTSWRILKWYHAHFLSKVFTFWTCKWMVCFHSRIWELSSNCPERFTLATLGYAELKEKGIGNPPGSHDKVIQGLDTSEVHLTQKNVSGILLPERNLQGTCISLGFAVLACVATNVVPWNVSLNF